MSSRVPGMGRALTDRQFTVKLPAESFHSYRCEAPDLEVEVSKEMLVDMYQKMVRSSCPSASTIAWRSNRE